MIKNLFNILTKIHTNDVLVIPLSKENKDLRYTIEYYRTNRTLQDSIVSITKWRITDHINNSIVAPDSLNQLIKILKILNADLDELEGTLKHHLALAVNWHVECIELVRESFGDNHVEECKKEQQQILENISDIVKDVNSGKISEADFCHMLMTGNIRKRAKLELVESGDKE